MPEMLFILGLALLIFGPAQLPKIGRQIGEALGQFKRASNEFKSQLEDEVRKLELDQLRNDAKQFTEDARGLKEQARQTIFDPPAGTVAKGSVEEEGRTILPPQSSAEPAAPAKAAGDHVG